MKVLVNGIGNIGSTLIQLLIKYKKELSINTIYANKNVPKKWHQAELNLLQEQGVIITSPDANAGYINFNDVLSDVNYIFEAGSNGSGLRNKSFYENLPNLKGVCAQGSEKGFGISFMSGVGDELILNQKFVHVVSCNTHGSASLLKTFSGDNLSELIQADFVVVRRSEDIGNHERLVSASVVARHLDPNIGTHHAIDVTDMFAQQNISCKITSSDITTPSQLMHAVRFSIELKNPVSNLEIEEKISKNTFIATTKKFDSNVVFELGRRYGLNGRIFSHAIIVSENLLIDKNTIKGWAFVPQEGNSIISTLHAYLLQTNHPNEKVVIEKIKSDLLKKEW